MFSLEELFCSVDDFCQVFEVQWERQLLGSGLQRRRRSRSLCSLRDNDDPDWVLLAIAVNPNCTSQNCSGCGTKVPKTLSDRLHVCPECGVILDRDHNAAINIKYLAVGHSVNKAHLTSEAIAGVDEKPALYAIA